MVETFKKTFDDWTSYDNWLISNYTNNSIYSVNEIEGKIEVEYCTKSDFQALLKEKDNK